MKKNPLTDILTKLGLKEREQKLVIRAVLISTALCLLLILGFWAFTAPHTPPDAPKNDEQEQEPAAQLVNARGITDLDIEAHNFAAQRYMSSGRPDAALPHLRRIAALRREDQKGADALDRMVTAYLDIGEFEHALDAAQRLLAITHDSSSASLQVRRATALYNLKEYDESSQLLQDVLAREPNNAEALTFMGQMEAAAQTRSPTAERLFRRAIEADPDYPEVRYQFARYFENNGDYRSAKAFLQQVLDKNPLHVRAHARMGMIYYYEGNPEMALRSYQTALALNPYDYNTLYNLGELYRNMLNDSENALREFVAVLDINPDHDEASFRAGLICVENDMFKEAIRYFEASLKENRRDIRRLLQLAAAYERLGDKRSALSVYKEITDIDPLHSIAIQKIQIGRAHV